MPASSASSSSGSSRSSRRSLSSRASSESRCVLTETYSPEPMLIAPAARPATPAITIADRSLVAPTAPMTMPAVETMPSLAPSTAARSQLSRLLSPLPCGSSSCGPITASSSWAVIGQIQASGGAGRNQGQAALAAAGRSPTTDRRLAGLLRLDDPLRHQQTDPEQRDRDDRRGQEDVVDRRPEDLRRQVRDVRHRAAEPAGDLVVDDRAEDRDPDRAPDRTGEHGRAGRDPAVLPRHGGLGGDDRRAGDQTEAEAHHEA